MTTGTAMTSSEAVLIFDGQCGFCTRSVEWLKPRIRRPVRYEPYQSTDLSRYGLDEAQAARSVWWVTPEGHLESGARAVGRALLEVGGPWRVVAWLTLVPPASWVAAAVYRFVANHRGWFPGTTPACRRDHWEPRHPTSGR